MRSCFWYGGGVWILYPPSLWCIIEWELWSMKVLGEGLCCRLEVLYWLNLCVLRQRRGGEEDKTTLMLRNVQPLRLLWMKHPHNVRKTCKLHIQLPQVYRFCLQSFIHAHSLHNKQVCRLAPLSSKCWLSFEKNANYVFGDPQQDTFVVFVCWLNNRE